MTAMITSAAATPASSAASAPIAIAPTVGKKGGAPMPSLLHQPTLIVLGRDESGKPHASWFDETEQKLASKAAALMGMRALSVKSDEVRQLASRLPQGRVFSSGRAFVPFVKAALFEEITAHLPASASGTETVPSDDGGTTAASTSGSESTPAGRGQEPRASRPADWPQIAVGSRVLASEGEGHGWYESVVEEARDMDIFILSWRDWPDLPHFARLRTNIALLHPAYEPD